mmetsp:Transcript_9432/g.22709  ORF Transcript_9432/g.22709 Transcript_9432/m.22709 type:complete len:634 (+) Transcript_9432:174-2075(+)
MQGSRSQLHRLSRVLLFVTKRQSLPLERQRNLSLLGLLQSPDVLDTQVPDHVRNRDAELPQRLLVSVLVLLCVVLDVENDKGVCRDPHEVELVAPPRRLLVVNHRGLLHDRLLRGLVVQGDHHLRVAVPVSLKVDAPRERHGEDPAGDLEAVVAAAAAGVREPARPLRVLRLRGFRFGGHGLPVERVEQELDHELASVRVLVLLDRRAAGRGGRGGRGGLLGRLRPRRAVGERDVVPPVDGLDAHPRDAVPGPRVRRGRRSVGLGLPLARGAPLVKAEGELVARQGVVHEGHPLERHPHAADGLVLPAKVVILDCQGERLRLAVVHDEVELLLPDRFGGVGLCRRHHRAALADLDDDEGVALREELPGRPEVAAAEDLDGEHPLGLGGSAPVLHDVEAHLVGEDEHVAHDVLDGSLRDVPDDGEGHQVEPVDDHDAQVDKRLLEQRHGDGAEAREGLHERLDGDPRLGLEHDVAHLDRDVDDDPGEPHPGGDADCGVAPPQDGRLDDHLVLVGLVHLDPADPDRSVPEVEALHIQRLEHADPEHGVLQLRPEDHEHLLRYRLVAVRPQHLDRIVHPGNPLVIRPSCPHGRKLQRLPEIFRNWTRRRYSRLKFIEAWVSFSVEERKVLRSFFGK